MDPLAPLVGLPLVDSTRAADLQGFHFGACRPTVDPRGRPRTSADYALHVQCAWRIIQAGAIAVASRDRYVPAGDPEDDPPGFEWDRAGANLCDERIATLRSRIAADPPTVRRIESLGAGAFRIVLERDLAIEVIPDRSGQVEHWRLFRPGRDDAHVTCVGQSIE